LATVFCGKGTVAKLTKEHSAELSDLSNQQTKALTDAIFIGMTKEQWSEYDNRPEFWRSCEMGRCLG
jgi:hypothetical protein